MRTIILFTLLLSALCTGLFGLSILGGNKIRSGNLDFTLELVGEQRTGDFCYAPLVFSSQSIQYSDSLCVIYNSPELDLRVSFLPQPELGIEAWQIKASASFHRDTYIRQLFFKLNFDDPFSIDLYKGVEAIVNQDVQKNTNTHPYTNKAVQYRGPYGSFWLVASNSYACSGVERLGNGTVNLYDHTLHFFRRFSPSTQAADLPRDTMVKTAGSNHLWSFLIYETKPVLLDISRWPTGKLAALCITNDADSECNNSLSAIFFGSSNPASPKYLNSGLIANDIKVSNTVFGINQNELHNLWQRIMNAGNSIGYHTYAASVDAPGTNEQALLHDLEPFNIRLWIDHNVPQNPEDLVWNGLDPSSENFMADIINQSNIDYAWFNDTPPTNPFNAFDDPWRLPHLIYEATALTKPVWFFGRTRAEVWEFTNGNFGYDMKSTLTAQNIENLLADRGLHISYTHLSAAWNIALPFFMMTPEGDYEIKDEVEDMLQMLKYYKDYRGLWIDTVESIFDRMLAIEHVQVRSIVPTSIPNEYTLTLVNNSAIEINDFSFACQGVSHSIDRFPAGSLLQIKVNKANSHSYLSSPMIFAASYTNAEVRVENKSPLLTPMEEIKLYNLRGQLVKTFYPSSNANIVNIPFQGAASGVYFLQVRLEGQTAWTGKFIILK
jgi:hypothetical protein